MQSIQAKNAKVYFPSQTPLKTPGMGPALSDNLYHGVISTSASPLFLSFTG